MLLSWASSSSYIENVQNQFLSCCASRILLNIVNVNYNLGLNLLRYVIVK